MHIEVVDGVTFELDAFQRHPSSPDNVLMRKTRHFTDSYMALKEKFKGCRMIEVGVDHGGSTSFFLKLFSPEGLLALELSDNPKQVVMDFLATHDPEQRVSICWGVNQADTVEVPRLIKEKFGDQPLDLVVDDASHILQPTTATFEMMFPLLRPGGLFIIEDWSSGHSMEREFSAEALANPDGELARKIAAVRADPGFQNEMPMSQLICQLIIACGRNPDWVSEIRAFDNYCEIRRGPAEIAPGTPISSYIGDLGEWMFDKTVG